MNCKAPQAQPHVSMCPLSCSSPMLSRHLQARNAWFCRQGASLLCASNHATPKACTTHALRCSPITDFIPRLPALLALRAAALRAWETLNMTAQPYSVGALEAVRRMPPTNMKAAQATEPHLRPTLSAMKPSDSIPSMIPTTCAARAQHFRRATTLRVQESPHQNCTPFPPLHVHGTKPDQLGHAVLDRAEHHATGHLVATTPPTHSVTDRVP